MLKSKFIIFMCLVFCFEMKLVSQHEISKYEYRWAFFHTFAAKKVQKHLIEAMDIYQSVKNFKQLDSFESGGTLDAFRHTFTMAYLSRYVKVYKLRKLGKAHEKGNKKQFFNNRMEHGERADSLACEMDLKNNELGFLIGIDQKNTKIEELKLVVLSQIMRGNAWILKKNNKNEYVSCNNEPISIKNYMGVWYIPKCLIKSNE